MTDRPPIGERQLLAHIRRHMTLLLMGAFVFLAGAIIGYTYWGLAGALTHSVMTAIERDEWPQHTDRLLGAGRDAEDRGSAGERGPSTDVTPELLATWIVAADGRVVDRDLYVTGMPYPLTGLLPARRLEGRARATRSPVFITAEYRDQPVLVAVKPVYRGARLLGYLETVASLASVQATLTRLLREDAGLAVGVLVAIIPLSLVLSRRTVAPIREALQRQRDFVHNASHELRTPLAIVRAALELAMPEPGDAHYETLKDAARSVEHLGDIVSDLSTLARMESGHEVLSRRPVNLSALVQETVEALRPLVLAKSIRMETSVPDAPLTVPGDPTRLRQLLLILGDNAVRYTPAGGVIRVALSAAGGGHAALLSVSDSGVGIAPADVPHIFNRFYRGRLTRSQPGTGLGLAIAQWIVQAHHGTIQVTSEPGRGTTFAVRLPLRTTRLSG